MNTVPAPGAPPIRRLQIDRLQNNHLQVLLQSRSIMACYKCISKLARSRPRSVSLSSLNLGLQLYFQTRSISATQSISKLAQSRPPSASLSSLNLGLQLHLQTRSMTASKCISEFARPWSPIASPSSLAHSLKVHL